MEIDPTQRILRQYTSGLNYCNHACKKRKHEIKGKNDDGKCKSEDYKEIDYCEHGKYTLSTKNSTTMHKKYGARQIVKHLGILYSLSKSTNIIRHFSKF